MNTNITKKQVAIVTGASSGMGLGMAFFLLPSQCPNQEPISTNSMRR